MICNRNLHQVERHQGGTPLFAIGELGGAPQRGAGLRGGNSMEKIVVPRTEHGAREAHFEYLLLT